MEMNRMKKIVYSTLFFAGMFFCVIHIYSSLNIYQNFL
jgi:hypothetical protein